MSSIDPEAHYRDQDKRMNTPDDDFNEYLQRMGVNRRQESLPPYAPLTPSNLQVNRPSNLIRPQRREMSAGQSTERSEIQRDSRGDTLKVPTMGADGASMSTETKARKRSASPSSSRDPSDVKRQKQQKAVPVSSLPASPPEGNVISSTMGIVDAMPTVEEISAAEKPHRLKRKLSDAASGEPVRKKGTPTRSVSPTPSVEEITSFTACPKIQRSSPIPKPIPRENPTKKATSSKVTTKQGPPPLEMQPINQSGSDTTAAGARRSKGKGKAKEAVQSAPSEMFLEIQERVAQHTAGKGKGSVKLGKRVIPSSLEVVEDSSVISDPSSSSAGPSASINQNAKASSSKTVSTKVTPAKAQKTKGKKNTAKDKKKQKPVHMTPAEYAHYAVATFARKSGPFSGMSIIYTGGDLTWATERTRGRMNLIVKNGGNLIAKYDPSVVTHIVTDAREVPMLRELGLKKLSDIPDHIPTLSWKWAVDRLNKPPLKFEPGKRMRDESLWMEAAFSSRMDAGYDPGPSAKGKQKEKAVDTSGVSDSTPVVNLNNSSSRSRIVVDDDSDSEAEELRRNEEDAAATGVSNGRRSELSASSSKVMNGKRTERDPLHEFYETARVQQESAWSRHGEDDDETDDEAELNFVPLKLEKRGWTCDNKGARSDGQPCANQDLVDKLKELKELHEGKPGPEEKWRVLTYNKCIGALLRYPRRIESFAEARSIRGIGEKTAHKIMEIIETGGLRRIGYEKTDDVQVTKLFQGIYGVGRTTAYQWYLSGCRTLQDLVKGSHGVKLTPAQEIGIRYYGDINDRMPRREAKEIFDLIKPIALGIDPKLFIEIMGSYRRGKSTCGDIDILITRPTDDGKTHKGVIKRLLRELHTAGILTEDLAIPESPDDLEAIYRGLCRLPEAGSRMRRIDFLAVPWESRGAALLYYTGDDIFNRAMRLKAGSMGYSLNQRGLFGGVVRDPKDRRVKLNNGHIVASETEEEIFKILNVPWQEPHERVRG